MPRYTIEERIIYEVDADDAEAALDVLVSSDDTDAYFVAVEDRRIVAERVVALEA